MWKSGSLAKALTALFTRYRNSNILTGNKRLKRAYLIADFTLRPKIRKRMKLSLSRGYVLIQKTKVFLVQQSGKYHSWRSSSTQILFGKFSSQSHSLFLILLICSLYDVIQTEKKLTLVFEYMDQDLKKYIDGLGGERVNVPVMKVPALDSSESLINWTISLFSINSWKELHSAMIIEYCIEISNLKICSSTGYIAENTFLWHLAYF